MQRYESKQVQIRRPAKMVYGMLSDFSNFTPILADRVEEWQATSDTCSFKAQGFTVALRIVEREADKLIKIVSDGGTPFAFTLWMQLHEVAPDDTRMRLVAEVDLNMMMRMMIGGKISGALDQLAQQIADSFNASAATGD